MQLLRAVGKLPGPLYLLLVTLTYVLGAGTARYLGFRVHGPVLVLGLVLALLLQAAMNLLAAAFRPMQEQLWEGENGTRRIQVQRASLYVAIAALAMTAVLAFTLLQFHNAPIGAAICLGLSILAIIVYALPPMRAVSRGYGELLIAAQIAYLVPTIGFLLQAGSLHRLLTLCALALMCMLVSTLLALELPSYAADMRYGRTTMTTRIGWEHAVTIHHALLLTAYLLLAFAIILGFSFQLIGPALLTFPFAVLQMFLVQGIARGAKPIWNLLRATAVAVFTLTAYFLALSFWLR